MLTLFSVKFKVFISPHISALSTKIVPSLPDSHHSSTGSVRHSLTRQLQIRSSRAGYTLFSF